MSSKIPLPQTLTVDERFISGDAPTMSLDNLRDLSIAIIKSSIVHPLGLIKLPPSGEAPFTPKERRLLDLHRELDALSRQIVEARESTGLSEKRMRTSVLRSFSRKKITWRGRDIRVVVTGETRIGSSRVFQSATGQCE